MDSYFDETISKIYGDDDDFIVIGLTGRTGSGCSTVANILSKNMLDIKHSLFTGHNPENNNQRKQKIIYKCVEKNWRPFIIIQASTILMLMLAELDVEESATFIGGVEDLSSEVRKDANAVLKLIKDRELHVGDVNSLKAFYADFLPEQNSKLKEIIGGAGYVKRFSNAR